MGTVSVMATNKCRFKAGAEWNDDDGYRHRKGRNSTLFEIDPLLEQLPTGCLAIWSHT